MSSQKSRWNARSSRPDPSRTGTPAPPATTLCKCMDSTQRKSAYGLLKNASRRMGPSPIPARRECFPTDGKWLYNSSLSKYIAKYIGTAVTGTSLRNSPISQKLWGEKVERGVYKSSTFARDLNVSVGFGFPFYLGRKTNRKSPHRERTRQLMEQKRKTYGLFPGNK